MRRQGGRPSREALSEEGHLLEAPLDEDSKNINSLSPDSGADETNGQKATIEDKTQAGTDPETQAETEGRTTAAAKGETDPKTQAGTEGRTTAAAKGETDPKTQAGTEGRTTAAAKGETDPKTKAGTEGKTTDGAKGETDPKTKAGTEGRTKPKTQAGTEGRTKPKTQAGTEGRTKPKTERANGASKSLTNTDSSESDANRIADIFFSFDLEKKSTKFRLLETLSKHTLNSEIVGLTERLHHARMCAKLKISDANLKKLLVRLSDEGLISIDRERSKLGRSGWVRYWVRKEAVEYYFKISDRARSSLESEILTTQANVE